ncbi:MAG: IS256 family transposase [Eubacteriales bacterium]|nr:IS256 family transposase [Eubacteriales bacterium]
MAQLNITLNQEEIQQLLSENREDAFRKLLENSLNAILKAESAEQLGAERYERNESRTDSRNGSRERQLNTRIGKITLNVPRHRNEPFKTLVFQNYTRSEAALISTMAEMVVNGVSSRKVSTVMETLCGTSFSKSTVSEACKELDKDVFEFKERPIAGEYPFVTVDATYFKVRENHRITSKAFMVALATNNNGKREILGFEIYDRESKDTWKSFFEKLKKRGLHGVKMFTSDAHEGIIHAISKVFPETPLQRCQTHFSRNIIDKAPKKYQAAIHADLHEMYNCETIKEARNKRDSIIKEYEEVAAHAMDCLDNGFESVMTVMAIPKSMRRFFRTSNHIERLNRELKKRSNSIGIFPNTASLERLMGSVLLEQNDKLIGNKAVPFKKEDFTKLDESLQVLRMIAMEQAKLLIA